MLTFKCHLLKVKVFFHVISMERSLFKGRKKNKTQSKVVIIIYLFCK